MKDQQPSKCFLVAVKSPNAMLYHTGMPFNGSAILWYDDFQLCMIKNSFPMLLKVRLLRPLTERPAQHTVSGSGLRYFSHYPGTVRENLAFWSNPEVAICPYSHLHFNRMVQPIVLMHKPKSLEFSLILRVPLPALFVTIPLIVSANYISNSSLQFLR